MAILIRSLQRAEELTDLAGVPGGEDGQSSFVLRLELARAETGNLEEAL
jgi:hypothetical protein